MAISRPHGCSAPTRVLRAAAACALLAALSVPATAGAQEGPSAPAMPPDPNATRLFFGPTGRSLPAGGGYAGVYGLFLPFVQVGITDRVSIGGGLPLLFPGPGVFWITPKVQIVRAARVEASAGVVHIANLDRADSALGVAYGVATTGSDARSFTVGAGWGYARADGHRSEGMLVLVAAERRISRRTKLITESYLTTDMPILMGGVRLIGERFSADLALMAFADRHDPLVAPMVNVVCSFGRER
jgi:hypothetical protein